MVACQDKPFDLEAVLDKLSEKRACFHSEADFQFALAQEIRDYYPKEVEIRLEYPLRENCSDQSEARKRRGNRYIDIIVFWYGEPILIELKYKTAELRTFQPLPQLQGVNEKFDLKNHSAQDIGRYDCIKDIERIECMIEYPADSFNPKLGYVVWLTNDPSYWKKGRRAKRLEKAMGDSLKEGAFYPKDIWLSIHDDRVLEKELDWVKPNSGSYGSSREEPIKLNGRYTINWKPWGNSTEEVSRSDEPRNAVFMYALIKVMANSNGNGDS